jgi:aldehyde dehydrogenase
MQPGFGRETHKMMLNHYRQTKNMLISYGKQKFGFFPAIQTGGI